MNLSKVDLAKEFAKRKPWFTKFVIDGVDYGGQYDASNDSRIPLFFKAFPEIKTVLELSCLEGGHTFAMAQQPGVERVLALEGRETNIEKARFVQRVLGIENVSFDRADLAHEDPAVHGRFDAIFCAGLLYHLPRPWELLAKLLAVSDNIYIWTHYVLDEHAHDEVQGYRGRLTQEVGLSHPLSGLTRDSFWPTLDDLRAMLAAGGFKKTSVLSKFDDNPAGPSVNLIATRA